MSLSSVKAIVCDVNGTMFSLAPLGERMQQVGLQKTDLQVLLQTCQAFQSQFTCQSHMLSVLLSMHGNLHVTAEAVVYSCSSGSHLCYVMG